MQGCVEGLDSPAQEGKDSNRERLSAARPVYYAGSALCGILIRDVWRWVGVHQDVAHYTLPQQDPSAADRRSWYR